MYMLQGKYLYLKLLIYAINIVSIGDYFSRKKNEINLRWLFVNLEKIVYTKLSDFVLSRIKLNYRILEKLETFFKTKNMFQIVLNFNK